MDQSEKVEAITKHITNLMQRMENTNGDVSIMNNWLIYMMEQLPTVELIGLLVYLSSYQVIGIKHEEGMDSVFGTCVTEMSESVLITLSNRLSDNQEDAEEVLENTVNEFISNYTVEKEESDNETDQSETS